MAVVPRANREIDIVIERDGNQQTIKVTPDARTKYEMGDLGVVPVVQAAARPHQSAASRPRRPA